MIESTDSSKGFELSTNLVVKDTEEQSAYTEMTGGSDMNSEYTQAFNQFESDNYQKCIVGMIGTTLSGGLVTVPQIFQQVGVFPGLILLILNFYFTYFTCQILLIASDNQTQGSQFSYESICKTLGINKFIITQLIILMYAGNQLSLLKVSSDILQRLLNLLEIGANLKIITIIIQMCVVFPITCVYRMRDFQLLTLVQISSILFVVVSINIHFIYYFIFEVNPDTHQVQKLQLFNFDYNNIVKAIPYVIFVQACQPWTLGVYEGMKNRSLHKMNYVNQNALLFIMFVQILMGLSGYLTFLDKTKPNVLDNEYSLSLMEIPKQVIALSIITGMPQNVIPMRNCFIEVYLGQDLELIDLMPKWKIVISAFFANAFVTMLAVSIDNLASIVTVFNDTLNVFACNMMPCLMFLMQIQTQNWNQKQNWIRIIFVLGLLSQQLFFGVQGLYNYFF